MIIDCAHYSHGQRQHVGAIALEDAASRCGNDGFVWLGLFEPSLGELEEVRKTFKLHELAVEDAQTFHLRPKVEEYADGVHLVILRTARYNSDSHEVDFGEISVFIAPSFVITVRQGIASELHGVRTRLENHSTLLESGTVAALWSILDLVVDSYAPVVLELERDIEKLEALVFSGAVAPTEQIYFLRREVTEFYRAVHPLLAVVSSVEKAQWADGLRPYFRDVQDHLVLVNEEVSVQRDLLTTVLEANMAVIGVEQTKIGVRQNASMEQLSKIATVFLPLTFVTGFFGQNFQWLLDNIDGFWAFLIFGVGGLVLPCVMLWMWFSRQRKLHPTLDAAPGADGIVIDLKKH